MNKVTVGIRLTEEQKHHLQSLAQEKGLATVTDLIRMTFLNNPKNLPPVQDDFRKLRLQRKSFRCEEELWHQIQQKTVNPSHFVRQAILEKLQKST